MPTISNDRGELYYEVFGDKTSPPILLIQGVGVAGSGWLPQTNALANTYQLAIYDNRGLGRSTHAHPRATSIAAMAADALLVLDKLGWETAHVVGHSMGGVIAQELALTHPRRVKSLALLCTFARGSQGARLTPWVLWVSLKTRLGTRRMRRHAFLHMLLPSGYLASLTTAAKDDLVTRLSTYIGRDLAESPPILLQQLRAMSKHNAYARLGELAGKPCLVVSAVHDPIALPRFGEELAAAIPQARFVLLDDAAHGVTIQKDEVINSLLTDFWTRGR